MPQQLPQIRPLPGETVYYGAEFHPNLILRYLSEGVLITDRRVVVRRTSTIFGLIPRGYVEESMPVDHISDMTLGRRTTTWKIIAGSVALVAALWLLLSAGLVYGGGYYGGGESALVALAIIVLLVYAVYQFLTAKADGFVLRGTGAGTVAATGGWGEDEIVGKAKDLLVMLVYGASRIPDAVRDQFAPPPPPGDTGPRVQARHAADPGAR
ncbi:hypothetical protein [Gordonia sp. (in: high G+C Gram-positive bacteria)]|uniref:hypothetical protein n=1 Tax=Gordonia sp. (in: high G+C Gram-positive bacteria) TaxID=84139 RepID=UPI0039E60D3A